MVIKVNHNYVAVFLAVLLVGVFCLFELWGPDSIHAAAETEIPEGSVRLPVVMYHHLMKNEAKLGDYVISPAQFEEDLLYIQKCGYTTISVFELMDHRYNGAPLPEKPILLTFDDGNESVYTYAYPLLEKYKMKAVVSIIGKYTDFYSEPDTPNDVSYANLTWDQIREMKQSGIFEIGNHTYNMHGDGQKGTRYGIRMKKGESAETYRQAILEDVGGLSTEMKEQLGEFPTIFAYPFGALCKESKPVLTEIGFQVILTCEEKVNIIPENAELPLVLKRYNRAHRYSTYEYFKRAGVVPPA